VLLLSEVESSVVERVIYESGKRDLYIQFKKGGAVWRYADVPGKFYRELTSSESVGKELPKIKKNFRSEKVTEDDWKTILRRATKRSESEVSERLYEANATWLRALKKDTKAVGF
jgi:hypothetical protein